MNFHFKIKNLYKVVYKYNFNSDNLTVDLTPKQKLFTISTSPVANSVTDFGPSSPSLQEKRERKAEERSVTHMKLSTLNTQDFVHESEKKKEDRMTEVNHREDAMIYYIFPIVLPKIQGMFLRYLRSLKIS